MNIEELRSKIDKIDTQLLKLLKERMGIVVDVGKIKNASKENVYRPEREKLLLIGFLKRLKENLMLHRFAQYFKKFLPHLET